MSVSPIESRAINAIRFLAIDAVQQANSGHPGMPMGAAPMGYALFKNIMRHAPSEPGWVNRDRFVLSAGHGSMLLYALLHLSGYPLSIEDLKAFRQWGSRTPGHPEFGHAPGVETTTGPLGQGFATGVGMAIAERHLAALYNRPSYPIVDHYTYGIVSDGDLMEGISQEAASLAGHLGLGKLIYLYDDNHISIDGDTANAFTEDVPARLRASGWHVVSVADGNDVKAIQAAVAAAQAETEKPSLIAVRTVIGYGSPSKAGSASSHGSPLGHAEIEATREALGWNHPPFDIPEDVQSHMADIQKQGVVVFDAWHALWERYAAEYPSEASELSQRLSGNFDASELSLPSFEPETSVATRNASGKIIEAITAQWPQLIGGSADLAGSNKTMTKRPAFQRDTPEGANFYFGVREHAMAAACNGMALHGGVIPYCATFLIFTDYLRPALRLSALMQQRVIYVMTHDSIGLGEDGPTHQPIEHHMALRAIPNVTYIRPCDGNETAAAWRAALQKTDGPTVLALSRQDLRNLPLPAGMATPPVEKGAYIVHDPQGTPDVILIGTGSEVDIAITAAQRLASENIHARVVSMPSWEYFQAQPKAYQEEVLPSEVTARVSVEAGITLGWERWVGSAGRTIGIDHFGASAPAEILYEQFGITAEHIVQEARSLLR
jgi:transketolase